MTALNALLSPDQLEQIRDELLRTLARLERSVKISGGAARPRDLEQDTVGRLSRIDALQNQGLTRNLEERDQQQLRTVVEALGRLEDGSYGACDACGETIAFNRLLVFPETRACTACVCTRG